MDDKNNNFDLLNHRISVVEGAIVELKQIAADIRTYVEMSVRLEERHSETRESLSRAYQQIGDLEHRLRSIESQIPVHGLTSRWVVSAITGTIGSVGGAVITFLLTRG